MLVHGTMQAQKWKRVKKAEDDELSAYQVELFLRFFEELDVHLRHGNLNPDDVKTFFKFYFDRLYHMEHGLKLFEESIVKKENMNISMVLMKKWI